MCLPCPPPQLRDDPPSGYFLVGDAATPRFEFLLDNRGGNYLNVRDEERRQFGLPPLAEPMEEEEEIEVEDGAANDDNNNVNDDGNDDDDRSGDTIRQRAIMLGLNILIQRNAASVLSDLRALGIGPIDGAADAAAAAAPPPPFRGDEEPPPARYRRPGVRTRAGQLQNLSANPRERIEVQRLLHR